jgi:hypothetical protein
LTNTVNLHGTTGGAPHAHFAHQNFAFQGKQSVTPTTNQNQKPHRHNP